MTYQVLARKWRPQQFVEVVGQESVTRTLQNAIKSDRIAHAFLFSGVRGVGKTSTARILAKALNCRQGPTPDPCGQCVSCQEISAANSVDVLEIDAASNTGVDNIRELRESVRYKTARDRFKIFIIDEVHMLSNAAFNALLKTLEEPPSHVKFILATTEYHKIPVTITSRCQQFEFKPLPFSLILERLKLISEEEQIEISDYALRAIAATAQGSMRDAQSALDQIVAFSDSEVRDDDVRTLLGVIDEETILRIVDAVLERKREGVIEQIERLKNEGVDPQNFCRKAIEHVRNLMVCKSMGWNERLLNLPDTQKEDLLKQSERFSELDLIRFYDVVNRAANELRWHSHPYVHLEMTLMKLIELAHLPRIEEVVRNLESGTGSNPSRNPQEGKQAPSLFNQKSRSRKPEVSDSQSGKAQPDSGQESSPERTDSSSEPARREEVTGDDAVDHLLAALQMENMMVIYSCLQSAKKIAFHDGNLLVVFPGKDSFHLDQLLEPKNRERVARLCAKITGSRPEIEARLETSPESSEPIDPTQDPKVKTFMQAFPGKMIVEKEDED